MWCRICGQDVPGIPSLDGGVYSCARCGEPVVSLSPGFATAPRSAPTSRKAAAKTSTASTAAQRPPIYDGWEIDEQLRHLRWVLGRAAAPREAFDEPGDQPKYRLDAGHDAPGPHGKRARRSSRRTERVAAARKEHAPGDRPLAVLAWLTFLLGTTGFVSGLALMGWSMNANRPDLWAVGAPIILAGQIILILGLVLQLDRSWRDNRWAAAKLETVDRQLHQLHDRTTGVSLPDAEHGPSDKFYAHWADNAGPDVLLSDLKKQLDLLAVKLSKP